MATKPFTPVGEFVEVDNPNIFPENQLRLPWTIDPAFSWMDYQCWVEVQLDAGMALHKPLPQLSAAVDTLASGYITDTDFDKNINGVNVASKSAAKDVIQRVATSTYRFLLKGYGLRAGYRIPIPGLKSVGGAPAIPDAIQAAFNQIVDNFSGIPLWYAQWELHYMVALPLGANAKEVVPANMAQHINGDIELPKFMVLPVVPVDSRMVPAPIGPAGPAAGVPR